MTAFGGGGGGARVPPRVAEAQRKAAEATAAATAERKRRDALSARRLAALSGRGGFNSSRAVGKKPQQIRPKSAGAFRARAPTHSRFKIFYDRRDLPLNLDFGGNTRRIEWKVDLARIDLLHYLPVFMDGLREMEEPYHFLAHQGTAELLQAGGERVVAAIPQLVIPMKQNLATRIPSVVCAQLRVLQKLVKCAPMAGRALVPYYRQLLQVFNLFVTKRVNVGDAFDYGQNKGHNLGDLIMETLWLMEKHGGEDAFVNIKFMVPTYESCV